MGHHEEDSSHEGMNNGGDAGKDHADDSHDSHDGHDAHDGHHGHDVATVGFGLLTISSSRTLQDDPTGDALADMVEDAGMTVETRNLVPDEVAPIRAAVEGMVATEAVDLVVTSGGTGLTRDDVTLQAVDPLFTRQIPGFGELFRLLSFDDIGARALLSRASAGLADEVPVFCVPGSEAGAVLGMEELILPTAEHVVGLAQRHED